MANAACLYEISPRRLFGQGDHPGQERVWILRFKITGHDALSPIIAYNPRYNRLIIDGSRPKRLPRFRVVHVAFCAGGSYKFLWKKVLTLLG